MLQMKMKKERHAVQQQSVPAGSEQLKSVFDGQELIGGNFGEAVYESRVNLGRILHL